MKRILICGIAIAAIATGVYLFQHYRSPAPAPAVAKPPRLNLLLISIDTVRTDYLQVYNPAGAPTPNLSRLAQNGFLFTHAIAQVPFTLPSHCTMLTGTYPMKHRVQDNTESRLSEEALTLAEVLKAEGYQTAGFIGSLVLESGTGIEQGFDTFDDSFTREDASFEDRGGVQKSATAVKRSFLRWLDAKNTSPFFSFVHFYDPHAPYDPPAPFLPALRTPEELYKGELQYVDSVIGEIYEGLVQRQLHHNTVVVVTGDHGEMLGEHREDGHGYFIYQQAIKVPLLILAGSRWKGTSDLVVELVDLMPTLLELLDVKSPDAVQGRSLSKLLRGEQLPAQAAYSESFTAAKHFGTAPLRSFQDEAFKYIDSPQPELYDLRTDPQELQNLWEDRRDLASRMKTALEQTIKKTSVDTTEQSDRELTPEDREKLSALGYIAPSVSTPRSFRDPKELIGSWQDLNLLSGLVKQPGCNECLALVDRMKKTGAFPLQARIFEARALAGLNRHSEAIAKTQEIIAAEPGNAQAMMVLAHSYKRTGQSEKALSIYKALMDQEDSVLGLENYAELMIRLHRAPELVRSLEQMEKSGNVREKHYPVLGEIFVLVGQTEKARQYLTKTIQTSPDNPAGYIHLSTVLDLEGKTYDAIQLLEQNRQRFANADYLFQMGRIYGKSGYSQKEYKVFQEMVQNHPRDPRGYFFLGKCVLEQQKDPRRVIALAQSGLSLNEDPELEPFGYFLLGDAYTVLGDKEKGSRYLKQAESLKQNSDNL